MDTSLAASGKDTSLVILYDGLQQRAFEQVRWEVEPIFDVMRSKGLGTTTTSVDAVPTGWRGTAELEVAGVDVDELLDTMIGAAIARIPGVLSFKESTKYRNLTTKSYLYNDCKITGAPKTVARGEKTKVRFQWESGQNRLAV